MNFFQKYNRKKFFRKLIGYQNINKSFKRIDNSKLIGLIIDYDDENIKKESEKFADFLQKQGKTVNIVYLSLQKFDKNNLEPDDTVSIINKKFEQKATLNSFCSIEYDILISCYCKEIYEYHYVASLTQAKFKVSPQYKELNYADLTFIIKENRIDNFFSAIKKYLIKKDK
jgi:predicted GTPase